MNRNRIVEFIEVLPLLAVILSLINLIISIVRMEELSSGIIIFICMVAIYSTRKRRKK